MGLCAYIIASQNGRPQLPVTAKVMAGFISLSCDAFWLLMAYLQSTVCFQALAVGTLPVLELMLEIQTED